VEYEPVESEQIEVEQKSQVRRAARGHAALGEDRYCGLLHLPLPLGMVRVGLLQPLHTVSLHIEITGDDHVRIDSADTLVSGSSAKPSADATTLTDND
jgi:hypothetical protein